MFAKKNRLFSFLFWLISGLYLSFFLAFTPFYVNSRVEFILAVSTIILFPTIVTVLPRSLSRPFAYLVITLLCNLAIGEWIISSHPIIVRKTNLPLLADDSGKEYDKLSRHETVRKLRALGKTNVFPSDLSSRPLKINPHEKNDTIYPLSSISNSTIVYCNEQGKRIIYKSNDYGFRSSTNISSISKNSPTYFLLGDSFVQGGCIDKENMLENQLKLLKPNDVVLSFGRGGSSLGLQYAIYREYVVPTAKIGDNLILFHYPANDFIEIDSELNLDHVKAYSDSDYSQNLINAEVNKSKDLALSIALNNLLSNKSSNSSTMKTIKNHLFFEDSFRFYFAYLQSLQMRPETVNDSIKNYFATLEQLRIDSNQKIKITVACIPHYTDFGTNLPRTCEGSYSHFKKYKNLSKTITWLNPDESFYKLNRSELFPFDHPYTHFSDYGYKEYFKSLHIESHI